jgi:hypothetical protein
VKKIVWFFPKILKNLCFGRGGTWPFPKHKRVICFFGRGELPSTSRVV